MSSFREVLSGHRSRYPLMQPQDYGKLAYQSEFGPEHLAPDGEMARRSILEEWRSVPPADPVRPPEPIGGGVYRFHLAPGGGTEGAAALLARLFCLTARSHRGTAAGLAEKLRLLGALELPGMADWLADYRGRGCPPVRHSPQFRAAYRPHYRLLRDAYACYFPALLRIEALLAEGRRAVVAVDGRCGSGKTRLAQLLADLYPCSVFHMDDFSLPPGRRPPDWEETPGGNMDLARFAAEVLVPARAGEAVTCRPYDCRAGALLPPVRLPARPLTVVEGSYSLHPALGDRCDLKIFLTCSRKEQERRLKAREGAYFTAFEERWIPMEERYIRRCGAEERSDIVVDTSDFFPPA